MVRFCIAAAVCGRTLSWIITTPQLSMPHRLFWIERRNFWSVSQQTPALIVEPWCKKSTSRMPFLSQNIVHMTFRGEAICLNFVFVGDEACLHSMDCCFNLGASCYTHDSFPVTTWLKKFSPSSLYCVRKSNVLSHPSPYHWTTYGMFSIQVTNLTTNFSRFHVLHIQERYYRPHFTCGGILYFLKHYKRTVRCVNTVQMSVNCVCALPQNQQIRQACVPSWQQCFSGNSSKRNLFGG